MTNTPMYFLGFIILVAGLAWGAFTIGVPVTWIAIGCVILTGIAMMSAVNYRTTTVVPGGTVTRETIVER